MIANQPGERGDIVGVIDDGEGAHRLHVQVLRVHSDVNKDDGTEHPVDRAPASVGDVARRNALATLRRRYSERRAMRFSGHS